MPQLRKRRRRRSSSSRKHRRQIIAVFVIFGLLAVSAFFFKKPIQRFWLASKTSGQVSEARIHMEHGKWEQAASVLSQALHTAPDDAEVLRTFAELLKRAGGNPADRVQLLQRLADRGPATTDDLAALADAHMRRGDLTAARGVLEALPAEARQSAETRQLEAVMLKMEGRGADAEAMLRSALEAQAGQDPAARFKLAVLDFKTSQPASHQRGAQVLWQHARAGDAFADDSIRLLCALPELSADSATELLRLATSRSDTVRQAALSPLLRLKPDERDNLIQQEHDRAAAEGEPGLLSFARWLALVGEHDRLAEYLPDETLFKAQALPPELLRIKLAALGRLGRWEEIRKIMTPAAEKHLGQVDYHLWLARLHALTPEDHERSRQHLTIAMNAATGPADSTTTALEATAVAVQMLDWRLAASFCQSAVENAPTAPARAALLERVLSFHHAAGDCIAASAAAREIAALTPGNESNAFRSDYLSLLAGVTLELIAAKSAAAGQLEGTPRANLIRAFCAYRLGMPLEQQQLLPAVAAAQNWPPGPRAVLAALLARSGEVSKAFQLAERIQSAGLLPEERQLLKLAR
jgi:hypothetical protein